MRTKLWNGWEIADKIGEGRTGDVYRAVKHEDGMNLYCAIKYISLPRSIDELEKLVKDGIINDKSEAINYYKRILDDIKKEIAIMKKFNGNSYIIDCYDYYQETKINETGFDFYLRMELANDITSYLSNKKDIVLDVIQMGIDICTALEACHKENIVHRDIKPNNIFIGNDGKFKLGDFGIANDNKNNNTEVIGTLNYMAPEVYNKEKITIATDIYSLGLVMYKFLNKDRLPFVNNFVNEDKAFKLRMSGFNIPSIKKIDKDLMKIIIKACSYEKNNRYKDPTSMKKDLIEVMKKYNNNNSISRKPINIIPNNFNKQKTEFTKNNPDKTISIYDAKRLENSTNDVNNNEVIAKNNIKKNTNNDNIFWNSKLGRWLIKVKDNIINFYNNKILKIVKNLTNKEFLLKNKWKILAAILIILFLLFLRGCVFNEKKCENGYISRLGICVKGYYTCSEGYVLNSDNKCSKTLKSIDANSKYTCEDGYTLQDKYCIKNDTKEPVSEYQCAGLGTLKGDKCVQEQSTDAAASYQCPSGYIYYDEKCFTASNQTAKTNYYCPSGYTLSGNKCTKQTYTNPTTGSGSYKCNSNETLNNGKCYVNATCSSSTPDYCKWYPFYPGCSGSSQQTCTCPIGYIKSGTQCYRNATYSSGSSYCTSGVLSGGKCVTTTTIAASIKYTCPSGYTVYGNQCIKTSSQKPTLKYYCAGGLTLKGNKCVSTITVDAIMGYKCDDGYVLAGSTCMLNDKKDAEVEYSCSKVYTLNGSKCEKYELRNPTPHYEK